MQLVSAAISPRLRSGEYQRRYPPSRALRLRRAFCSSVWSHMAGWLVRTPAYKILLVPIEQKKETYKLE